jgi:hypothetical protein
MVLCKTPQEITFSLTEEQNQHILQMAKEIHACPVRSHGRAYDTIYRSVRNGAILEYALVAQGAVKNNAVFDHTDPLTYCWDVFWDGMRAEVKCFYFDSSMSWVSFPIRFVQTFINTTKRGKNLVDIIIFGYYNETPEGMITAKWRLIAPSDTFASKLRKCNTQYKNSYDTFTGELKCFYSHPSEPRAIFIK